MLRIRVPGRTSEQARDFSSIRCLQNASVTDLGEKDELTEVLELFDHALLTGIRARTRLSRLCKSCLEMEWKVDDMTMAIVSNDILTDRQIAKHIAAH